MSEPVAPPGWPGEVRAPDAPDWEASASSWLLDLCPPEYRLEPTLRRHVVLLARFALVHVEGRQVACRRGLSEARAELRGVVDEDVVEEAIYAWLREDAHLAAVRREVGLVEEALRGRRFNSRL